MPAHEYTCGAWLAPLVLQPGDKRATPLMADRWFPDRLQGRLGHGDMEPCFEPQQITGNSMRGQVLLVALGGIHSAAVMEDGKLFTWGYGEDGALGQPKQYRLGFRDFNEKENRPIPTLIDPGRLGGGRVTMAACGLVRPACEGPREWF